MISSVGPVELRWRADLPWLGRRAALDECAAGGCRAGDRPGDPVRPRAAARAAAGVPSGVCGRASARCLTRTATSTARREWHEAVSGYELAITFTGMPT